ncbi:GtrA family protein [uncultured Shewanella sp.]|uniref:GtrA family protein n=1 Tax=uncultured Shewanella sp. TaxID=173975 RepID=UPI00260CB882|nr:GtrA family protein [uncultured Shewanella sp.]
MNNEIRKNTYHFWQLNRFALVGGMATLVHLSLSRFILFYQDNLPELTVNSVAFFIAFFISFLGHRHFTFKTNGSIIKFLSVSLLGFLINNSLLFYIVHSQFLTGWDAIFLSTLSVPILTYVLAKLWVFK